MLGSSSSRTLYRLYRFLLFFSCCDDIHVHCFARKIGEVGELSEIFQWRGEVDKGLPNWKEAEKEHLGEELSDVLLYLVRLADICGIDLGDAVAKKIAKNAVKYPPNKAAFF